MSSIVPESIEVTVYYDKGLQKLTGKESEAIIVNENMAFIMLLFMLFQSYPQIQLMYPPGTLGLLLNGKQPHDFDILRDKDKINLLTAFPLL